MNQKQEKKWCAWCGAWGDHTSGSCPDLCQPTPVENQTERGCMMLMLALFMVIILAGAAIGILTLITPEPPP